MAFIYVMEQPKHTYNEIITSLVTNNEVEYFLKYLKNNSFEADELTGLKLFLENNKYDIQQLKNFIEPPLLNIKAIKQKNTFANYYKIAASILLLVSAGWLIKMSMPNKSTSIDKYWVDDAGFKIWMSSENKTTLIYNGMSYYRAENYKLALDQFLNVKQNDTAIYYSAICYVKLNDLENAEMYFKQVMPQSQYKNNANFYLSLCYLNKNKQAEALKILNTVTLNDVNLENKRQLILRDISAK